MVVVIWSSSEELDPFDPHRGGALGDGEVQVERGALAVRRHASCSPQRVLRTTTRAAGAGPVPHQPLRRPPAAPVLLAARLSSGTNVTGTSSPVASP